MLTPEGISEKDSRVLSHEVYGLFRYLLKSYSYNTVALSLEIYCRRICLQLNLDCRVYNTIYYNISMYICVFTV